MFDFSAAALLAGGAASMALFLAGLAASHGGAVSEVRRGGRQRGEGEGGGASPGPVRRGLPAALHPAASTQPC